MVIEISSKPKLEISPIILIGAGVCLILGLLVLASYFYFDYSIKKLSQEIQKKEEEAAPTDLAIKEKEQEIIPIKEKIDDFKQLILAHKNPSDVFSFLQNICLPKVWFSNFSFDSVQNQAIVSGYTDSFAILEQQISIIKQEQEIININISEVSIAEDGGISFTLQLYFYND